jgi:predicted Zn-dependent peptidase
MKSPIMEERVVRFELSNGVRIIHSPSKSDIVHCALMINAGTRDEEGSETGLAHLIEHSIFKGTKTKTSLDILNSIDSVGGELNAYTTKEETCVYASCGLPYFGRAIELLCDITRNSTFPAKEVAKEKDVISDEIHSYLDSPAEQIHDDFEGYLFAKHPLGRNILGIEKEMRAVRQSDIIHFIKTHYRGNKIVFSSSGNVSLPALKKLAEKHLGKFATNMGSDKRIPFTSYKPIHQTLAKDTHQAHVVKGNVAYHAGHKNRTPFILLNNLLGGPAMNSRLNLGIREKYGFTYQLESNYISYSDTGIFSIYFGTDPANLNKTEALIEKELNQLRSKKLSNLELRNAIEQLCGQVALSQESRMSNVIGHAKNILLYDRVDPISTWVKKVRSITAKQIQEMANEVFDPQNMSQLIFTTKK